MAIETYDVGDDVRLKATITDIDDTAFDPTGVIILVKKPDGSMLTYLSSTGFTSQGTWDASANSPSLADGTGTAGHYYTVSTAGTQTFNDESITFAVDDYVYYNGATWRRLQNVQSTELTKSSTGVYYIDQYLTNQPGTWWYGSDTVDNRAAEETYFFVREQELL